MKEAFDSLMWSSLGAALLAPLVAAGIYVYGVLERGLVVRKTLGVYLLGVGASGVASGFVGMYIGAFVVCSLVEKDNCGFGGSLVGAPLGFALGIAAFVVFWARRKLAP